MNNTEENNVKESFFDEIKKKQPDISKHFIKLIKQNKLAHAYLFNGPAGSGKLDLARLIAMTIFCNNKEQGIPCGKCDNCNRIVSDQHPDVIIIFPEGQTIKVEQVRLLKQEFSKSGVEGSKKVFVINQADRMTNSSFNSLLKFIEEPNGNVTSILLTEHKNLILPTIISRTQVLEFSQNNFDDLNQLFQKYSLNQENMQLAKKLTNNVELVNSILEENWLLDIKKQLENWIYLMNTNKDKSFINVQSEIMPLAKNREQQEIIIKLIFLLFQDVFNVHFKQYEKAKLTFQGIDQQIKEMSNGLSNQSILDILSVILDDEKKIKHNLSFQNLIEMINLKIISIMDKN